MKESELKSMPKPETAEIPQRTGTAAQTRSLSRRLLALIVVSIMIVEVIIYIPSVGRFWRDYLEEELDHGYWTAAAADVMAESGLNSVPHEKLLSHIGIHTVVLRRQGESPLVIGTRSMLQADKVFDLNASGLPSSVMAAFAAMGQGENRILRVIGRPSEKDSTVTEILIDEAPLRRALIGFSARILALSVLISLFTAGFVFLSLRRLVILPLRRITQRITRFRENPEAPPSASRVPESRTDEIGAAEHELIRMHNEFRLALRQRTRLAALGAAMGKINHSLRNTLTTAVMASDVLSALPDPEVKQITQRLANAVKRAVMLCNSTLDFAVDAEPPFNPAPLKLRALVKEVFTMVRETEGDPLDEKMQTGVRFDFNAVNKVESALKFKADHDQLFRALYNLVENALQAGACRIEIDAILQKDNVEITVRDNGPGLNSHLRSHLFEPLFDINRKGGAGLGLVIVRDVARAHRGGVELAETGPSGTVFSLKIPRTL